MHVIVVGAGEVGHSIASSLAQPHDVIVVEQNDAVVEALTNSLDVLFIHGDGTNLNTLHKAGISQADLVIACTNNDETNIIVCGTTKTVSDAFTIARVRKRILFNTWRRSQNSFDVDYMICSDLLTAQAIARIAGIPATRDVDTFAGGLIQMAEFEIEESSPIGNQTVNEADQYDSLTFAAIFRANEMEVATGETVLRPGDRVVVIGSTESVKTFAEEISACTADHSDDVVIVGASQIGFQVAQEFVNHGYHPRLIEQDHDRARDVAEKLPQATVLESDATDLNFLSQEHIDEADIVISALDEDEENLLMALLSRRLGVERTVAVIEDPEYGELFATVGIDVTVNPQEETAEEIIRFTRSNQPEKIVMLERDQAEVIEIEATQDSTLTGRPIIEAMADVPDGVVIGAISRGENLVTPRGMTEVRPGDHVVIFVDADVLSDVIESI